MPNLKFRIYAYQIFWNFVFAQTWKHSSYKTLAKYYRITSKLVEPKNNAALIIRE